MKYIWCIWLYIVGLVCHAQHRVVGLHVQQAPEIIQRITRQAARYGGGGGFSIGGTSNYRPVSGPLPNYKLRTPTSDVSSSLTSAQLNAVSNNPGQRNVGVGAYSFGGMASGRPSNGNSFAVNTANLGKVSNNKGGGNSAAIRAQPSNQAIIGSANVGGSGANGARPQQLQQALLQAAQYQLQHQQQQQQQQQLRRQLPQQQLYRQRPAPSTYQQFH